MTIKFISLHIHHFLSFDDATIDLQDKGYCLVSGVNRNPKDFAKSNGAGKSTIFNAISFALTGETLQGLKSNLANIYFDDGCYVELEFQANGHTYKLLRSKGDSIHGTDLKIYIDNEDKSGKGIRESSELLSQYLPDLTSELIGSTILIGQGMPMKFTSNSPSGRKEVLEHLSQSDFMIQDLKDRISRRMDALSSSIREVEDKLLELTTKKDVYTKQLDQAKIELEEKFANPIDFDAILEELTKQQTSLNSDLKTYQEQAKKLNEDISSSNEKLVSLINEKNALVKKYFEEHQEVSKGYNTQANEVFGKIIALKGEIQSIKDIKDVCPLCHQKIPNVNKPDTFKQEELLKEYEEDLASIQQDIEVDNLEYQEVLEKVNKKYDGTIEDTRNNSNTLSQKVRIVNESSINIQNSLQDVNRKINDTTNDKKFYLLNKQRVEETIKNLDVELSKINNEFKTQQENESKLTSHNEVLSKMNTIVKRDFRGFLLRNIIDYINATAKEYASQIFGCDEIAFELDGNDINISFCGKDYENLSGGEKQRVDLIVQFSIRSFLCKYLNFSSNILVLDEISDALDSESCDRVINFITNELKDIESVFIISHHSDTLSIPYDSEIVVEKNNLGVSHVIF